MAFTVDWGTATIVTPNGVTCATVNQFVVIGLAAPDQWDVQWSAIGDPTDWPTIGSDDARAKQSGKQTLPSEYGRVTGIAGNDFFGYVFQERAVTKMTYVGGEIVFTFDTFEIGRGCWALNRYEQVDDAVFFESEFGYHMLINDQITDIGHGKINKTYPPQSTTLPEGDEQQNVAINKAINTVFFESQNLAYNYKTDQWTRQPNWAGFSYFSIDDPNGLVGRADHTGSPTRVRYGDQSGGTVGTATFETGEFQLHPEGGRAVVDSVRPITNGGSLSSLSIRVRDTSDGSESVATGSSVNSRSGKAHFRGGANPPEGRFVKARFVFTGGFTTISGAEFDFTPAGKV
jgi:hypothetical protein